jgi:uncharacterized protein
MSATRSGTHLDPRAPLVLDTRELGRRPGSMRRVQRTVPAPEGWGLELVRVPAGSDVSLDLRLEAVMDGVLVTGTVRAVVAAECGRCLEPVSDEVVADIQELYAYDPSAADDEAFALVGDFLDLEPAAHDTVVLSLPLNPVCDDGCVGLCPACGDRIADLGPDHHHDETDSRWAALAGLHAEESPASPEIGS